MFNKLLPWIGFAYMGAAWGLSFSLAKLVAIEGTTPIGIAFWQCLLAGLLLLGYVRYRGRQMVMTRPAIRLYIIIALLGTAIPSVCFYYSASRLPAGVLAITVTLVPILTYGLALLLRSEILIFLNLQSNVIRVKMHLSLELMLHQVYRIIFYHKV